MAKPKRTKKANKAVALRYDALREGVPRVAAKGTGGVADRIIEIAEEHGIPVKSDPDLVEVLSKLDIEEEIPADVYVAVAELLAFVYALNGKKESK